MTSINRDTNTSANKSARVDRPRMVTILGPTSTGKTSLAIKLCKEFNGEIISADSRQIYKYADVGTNKVGIKNQESRIRKKANGYWVQDGVRINLYDVVEPDEDYTASQFMEDAAAVTHQIWRRGKQPFLVGGTGFYISAFLGDVKLSGVSADPKLREKLQKLPLEELQKQFRELNPKQWKKMDCPERLNPHRLIRAIEIVIKKQAANGQIEPKTTQLPSETRVLKIGLRAPRKQMYHKADRWAHRIIVSGKLIKETQDLLNRGYRETRLLNGIIYAPTVKFIDGEITNKTKLVQTIQGQLHAYIRRQMRWFKRDEEINWFDVSRTDYRTRVEKIIKEWYSKQS